MTGNKRTYSTKSHGNMDQYASWKRFKSVDPDDELCYPKSTLQRPQQSSSLLKRGLNKHNGPVSFTKDYDSDTAPVFENSSKGKLKLVTNKSKRANGSLLGLGDPMDLSQPTAESNARPTLSHLPTPPIEMQKQQRNLAAHFLSNCNGGSTNLATQVTTSAWKRIPTPKSQEDTLESKESKQPHVPKQYEANNKASAPCRDILGGRLSRKSNEAKLWLANQSKSPFLRLPAEIRNRIYEGALGGNTIVIGYETYNSSPYKVVPVFKYNCTVYGARTDPFMERQNARIKISKGFTLFNSVCRQIYLETNVLVLKLNLLAFMNYNVMVNFLLLEQRFSLNQRLVIKELALFDMPGSNILTFLPNLEQVFLGRQLSYTIRKGWYRVVRSEGVAPKLEPKTLVYQ
ncbi:hypothetical protein DE146DRAFT_433299 [Phaeosphaeria sp. MPI-PUGE-AT-0046c]|nr:hypothetical protein DE146DRAFT_433299 [Phaeosphaeria sp. MPI-PUGE-AT-0046c]